jgi:hypothetical protein
MLPELAGIVRTQASKRQLDRQKMMSSMAMTVAENHTNQGKAVLERDAIILKPWLSWCPIFRR